MYDLKSIVAFRETKGRQKLVLDTNLLILLFVGYFDAEHIDSCPRLNAFTKSDYFLLLEILKNFEPEIVITPHVLSELSNLSKRKMALDDRMQDYFTMVIEKLKAFHEEHIPLIDLIGLDLNAIVSIGFSDITIIEAAKKLGAIILSNDFDMVNHALGQSLWAINFTNIRTAGV